ncbi:hypothetical protein DSO57_1003500 [Entomophthora muscae]|uniref:Uncharacterized protein n=1 Tax=Entomophthora muscae TaxID=34485 RepID=A0ACC2RNE0_9FUNG|nr:hypothetical protein DSO57_1003500 [Entomophthora muscae]
MIRLSVCIHCSMYNFSELYGSFEVGTQDPRALLVSIFMAEPVIEPVTPEASRQIIERPLTDSEMTLNLQYQMLRRCTKDNLKPRILITKPQKKSGSSTETRSCYKHNQPGHLSRDCPTKPKYFAHHVGQESEKEDLSEEVEEE